MQLIFFPRESCRLNTNQPRPLPPPSASIAQATDGDFQEQDSAGSNELKEENHFWSKPLFELGSTAECWKAQRGNEADLSSLLDPTVFSLFDLW